jgi:ATP-dependent exoDNAse (exonuclease V) alpha subunit
MGSNRLAAVTASQVLPAQRDESLIHIGDCGVVEGDSLVAGRNLKDWQIINGHYYTVTNIDPKSKTMTLNNVPKPLPWRLLSFFQFTHALTTHRFQISGTPKDVCLIVISNEEGLTVTREWLYTALSYAKDRAYVIGYRPAYKRAIEVSARDHRHCALPAYLSAGL